MATTRQLTEAQIHAWVGETSYRKGQPYAREAILYPRCEGGTLLAQCQGAMPTPYRVSVTLGGDGIASAECSCSMGEGGRCPHVAALLIAWATDPTRFVEREPLETVLERLTREELIAAIRRMVRRDLSLDELIEMPLAGDHTAPPVDVASIRRQVAAAFHVDPLAWGAAFQVKEALLPLVEMGNEYLAHNDYENAAPIFRTIMQGILEYQELAHDRREPELLALADTCADRLSICLRYLRDPVECGRIVRTLFAIRRTTMN